MPKHGSCCAVVIDSEGIIHYGHESAMTDRAQFFATIAKAKDLPNGDVLMLVGSVRSGEKLAMDLPQYGYNVMAIPKTEWLLDPTGEWEGEALLLRQSGDVFWIGGPFECIQLKTPGYFAIGSGGQFAHGVLWKMLAGKKKVTANMAKAALQDAIEAACALDDYCGGQIFIKSIQS